MRLLLLAAALALPTQPAGNHLLGSWQEPGGSIIRVATCGAEICATLIAVSKEAPTQFDAHNPDAALRQQRLCGLTIGKGFHPPPPITPRTAPCTTRNPARPTTAN